MVSEAPLQRVHCPRNCSFTKTSTVWDPTSSMVSVLRLQKAEHKTRPRLASTSCAVGASFVATARNKVPSQLWGIQAYQAGKGMPTALSE